MEQNQSVFHIVLIYTQWAYTQAEHTYRSLLQNVRCFHTHTHLFIYCIVGYFYYFHPGFVQLIMAQGQNQAARDTNIQSYPEKCPSTHISGRSLMITLEATIKKEGHRNNLQHYWEKEGNSFWHAIWYLHDMMWSPNKSLLIHGGHL